MRLFKTKTGRWQFKGGNIYIECKYAVIEKVHVQISAYFVLQSLHWGKTRRKLIQIVVAAPAAAALLSSTKSIKLCFPIKKAEMPYSQSLF